MVVTGDLGTTGSASRVPDQGMMIHLSVVTLLDQLRGFLRGDVRYLRYYGVDTSFTLVLRRGERHVAVSGRDGLLGRTTGPALAAAVLDAAEDLLRVHPLPPGDPVAGDYRYALAEFRPSWRPGSPGGRACRALFEISAMGRCGRGRDQPAYGSGTLPGRARNAKSQPVSAWVICSV
ncbi:hypothetical protein ACQ4WX_14280 [Streptomyces lasalocidi]